MIPELHLTVKGNWPFPRPRGGDPIWGWVDGMNIQLFPAHAGVILTLIDEGQVNLSFPRPRGGDPFYLSSFDHWLNFSPPTRG